MIFPKATRELIYASEGREIDIDWPLEEPKLHHRYSVQSSGRKGTYAVRVLKVTGEPGHWQARVQLDGDEERPLRSTARQAPDPADSVRFRPEFEPEQVDAATQIEITADAGERFRQQRLGFLAAREGQKLDRRLADVLEEAKRQRVNISPKVRAVERQIQALEKELYGRRAAA